MTRQTRQNVQSLLRSDEEVDEVEAQMSQTPIKEVKISMDTTMFLTQDYFGKKYVNMGN